MLKKIDDKTLQSFLDGELSKSEENALKQKILIDKNASEDLKLYKAIYSDLSHDKPPALSPKFSAQVMNALDTVNIHKESPWTWPFTLFFAAVSVLGGLFYFFTPGKWAAYFTTTSTNLANATTHYFALFSNGLASINMNGSSLAAKLPASAGLRAPAKVTDNALTSAASMSP